jgi:hypothetical protein
MDINGQIEYGEVQFYFVCENERSELSAFAVVSLFSRPDPRMLEDSYHTLWACKYQGLNALKVVSITSIRSIVSMQRLTPLPSEDSDYFFVVEKSGLDDIEVTL